MLLEVNGSYEQIQVQNCNIVHLEPYPTYPYKSTGFEAIMDLFPSGKARIFVYGSLMNRASLGGTSNAQGKPTVKAQALDTMRPVVAHDLKRLYNYEDQKGYPRVSNAKEKAYLNLARSQGCVINGVAIEVDIHDLRNLVEREVGYDLVPIFISRWSGSKTQNQELHFELAYTFMASTEAREGKIYTRTDIYPIVNYLSFVENAALQNYGDDFLAMFKETTYLADGLRLAAHWDRKTFL